MGQLANSFTEAGKLMDDILLSGIVEEIVTVDKMFMLVPAKTHDGQNYPFNRELTLSNTSFKSINQTITSSSSTATEVILPFREINGQADVAWLNQKCQNANDLKTVQSIKLAKSVSRQLSDKTINGSGSAPDIYGLLNLVTAAQTTQVATNGGELSFGNLDVLSDSVKIAHDTSMFVMNSAVRRKFKALLRTNNDTLEPLQLENYRGDNVTIHTYDGIPVIRNDYVSITETLGTGTNLSSIYLVGMSNIEGFCYIFKGDSFQDALELSDIGEDHNSSNTIIRVKMAMLTALHSTLALARLKGIETV